MFFIIDIGKTTIEVIQEDELIKRIEENYWNQGDFVSMADLRWDEGVARIHCEKRQVFIIMGELLQITDSIQQPVISETLIQHIDSCRFPEELIEVTK